MNKIITIILIGAVLSLSGCSFVQNRIDDYQKGKEHCSLNSDDVTRFNYNNKEYVILDETVPSDFLDEWVGYIRKMAVVNTEGQLVSKDSSDAKYIVPFQNIYLNQNKENYIIVDAAGEYHKAVPATELIGDKELLDYRQRDSDGTEYKLCNDNATQLICGNRIYQVTDTPINDKEVGRYIDIIAENVVFDENTKKELTNKELLEIDMDGNSNQKRLQWMYGEVHEISGTEIAKSIAVQINNSYYIANAI